MEFTEKYCLSKDAGLPESKDKIAVSNDAFAVGDIILDLINKLESLRALLI